MSAGVVHTRVFLLILVLAQLCAAVRDAVGDDEHAKPFDRASVEAPPDALDVPEGRGSTTLVAKFKARFSESQGDQGEFHRGSVESGSKSYHALPFGGSKGNYYYSYSYGPEEEKEVKIPETLQYYGAAAGVPKLRYDDVHCGTRFIGILKEDKWQTCIIFRPIVQSQQL